jgi:hypothetical protein
MGDAHQSSSCKRVGQRLTATDGSPVHSYPPPRTLLSPGIGARGDAGGPPRGTVDARRRTPVKKMRIAIAALLAVAGLAAQAQPDRSDLHPVPVDQLKNMYLQCERQASSSALDAGDAADCSMVSEELLARAFDGDFSRLLQWWRTERAAASVCNDPGATPGPEACDQG